MPETLGREREIKSRLRVTKVLQNNIDTKSRILKREADYEKVT
jgi:hypothetical protein